MHSPSTLLFVQESAVKQPNLVPLVNAALERAGAKWQIKRARQGSATAWEDPSLNGRSVKCVIKTHKSWLPAFFELSRGDQLLQQKKHLIYNLWGIWEEVNDIGHVLEPTPEQKAAYGTRCKQLLKLYRLAATTKHSPYYLHALAMHGASYLEALGSLAKFR
jgi:hypothetical protein